MKICYLCFRQTQNKKQGKGKMTLEIDKRSQGLSFSPEKIQLLKDTVCKGATDAELEMFMHICKHTGLDPFMKQIYSIPRKDHKTGITTRTIQTSIDGFRLIAERTGKYAPGRESKFEYDEKGIIISATSYVRKMTVDGTWHDVAATAYMDEFRPSGTYPNPFWTKMPHVMLAKVAEAVALRKAFPADLSGIYTSEEMDQAEVQIIEEVVNFKPKEEVLLLGLDDDVKQLYMDYMTVCKAHFKKKLKKEAAWTKEWLTVLERYEEQPAQLNKDVMAWNEKQVAKNQTHQ